MMGFDWECSGILVSTGFRGGGGGACRRGRMTMILDVISGALRFDGFVASK